VISVLPYAETYSVSHDSGNRPARRPAFYRIDMGEKVIINIRAHQDGRRPLDRVLPNRV
jgi:hypothetical protein